MTEKQPVYDDEISLKEIILKLGEWKNHLLSKWKILLLAIILGGLAGLGYSFYKKPIYKAELTFVLEESGKSSGGLGAYAGLASQFGINLGGLEGGNNLFAGDNIMELMRSRTMLEKTLLTKVTYKGQDRLLIDIYADFTKLKKAWAKSELTKKISFPVNFDSDKATVQEDSVLGKVCQTIRKENLVVEKVDKKLSIIAVRYSAIDEHFAKQFTEALVKNVSEFYVQTKTKKARENLDILQSRTDSVRQALDAAIYGTAAMADQSLNLVSQTAGIARIRKQRDAQVLGVMYTELVKNLEIAKFSLMREQPLVQVVDAPILPLNKERVGKIKGMVVGGGLLGLLICAYFIAGKVWTNMMS